MNDQDLECRLKEAANRIAVPKVPLRSRAHRAERISAVALTAVVLVGAIVVGQQLAARRGVSSADSATPPASPSPALSSATATAPTPSPARLSVPFESRVLGYRMSLPDGYRRSDCLSGSGTSESLGMETFTLLSVDQERGQDRTHVARGGTVAMWTFSVIAYRVAGMSAVELLERGACPSCDRTTRPGEKVEPTVVNGLEAARTIATGEARLYAVRVADRLYVIEFYSNPYDSTPRPAVAPLGVLDIVAATFEQAASAAPATPTAQPQVTTAARSTGAQLADAFAAADSAALRALVTPRCWLETTFPNAGPLGRAADPHLAELKGKLDTGVLRVRVDPTVQVAPEPGPRGLSLFVRSDWSEAGISSRVDLFLDEIGGLWYWAGERHYAP